MVKQIRQLGYKKPVIGCDGYYEQMHFVAGRGTITGSDGVVTAIGPGVVMLCPDGWSGTWKVDETVRKTYAIVKTA